MRHRRQKLTLGAVGGLRLTHRVLRQKRRVLGLLFSGNEGALGVSTFEQRPNLVAVIFKQGGTLTVPAAHLTVLWLRSTGIREG
jgi:hypothetical protein